MRATDGLAPTSFNAVAAVSCPSRSLCVSVDDEGRALWSTAPLDLAGRWHAAPVTGEWPWPVLDCPTPKLCVGGSGRDLLTSRNPTGGRRAWRRSRIIPFGGLAGLACPTEKLCVGLTYHGEIFSSTHPTGGKHAWRAVTLKSQAGLAPSGLSCPTPSFCAAVTGEGEVITSTRPTGGASSWRFTHIGSETLTAISCPSVRLCVAGDLNDEVLTTTDPTGGPAAWHVAPVGPPTRTCGRDGGQCGIAVTLVSCASITSCVLDDGDMLATSNPTGGRGAWTPTGQPGDLVSLSCTSSLCAAGGQSGRLLVARTPSQPSWPVVFTDQSSGLFGVACMSSSRCLAYGGNAGTDVVVIAHDRGHLSTALEQIPQAAGPINAIGCQSVQLCVAAAFLDAGDQILTTTNPRRIAMPWQATTLPTIPATGISCPSTTTCVAVDGGHDISTATNLRHGAGGWQAVSLPAPAPSLSVISCPTMNLCVAGGTTGPGTDTIAVSRHPDLSATGWTLSQSSHAPLESISCPSTSLCAGVRDDGALSITTRPTLGASAWRITQPAGHHVYTAVSCTPSRICIAVDTTGHASVSTNPAAGRTSWHTRAVDDNRLTAISCVGRASCAAVDAAGNVLTVAPALAR